MPEETLKLEQQPLQDARNKSVNSTRQPINPQHTHHMAGMNSASGSMPTAVQAATTAAQLTAMQPPCTTVWPFPAVIT